MDNSVISVVKVPVIDNEPWQKMPGETPRAYAAFLTYKNLAPRERSLKRAVTAFYGTFTAAKLRQYQHWSSRNMWVDRVSAWDAYKADEAAKAHIDEIKVMTEQHIRVAKALISTAVERLKTLDPLELSPNDALRFIIDGIKIQRLALGEPDEIKVVNESLQELTFTEMTDDELIQQIVQLRINRATIKETTVKLD